MRDHFVPWLVRWWPAATAVTLAAFIVVGLTSPTPPSDRAEHVAAQLRCPVCQSESVADSTATTARQMRDQIDDFVAEGRSETEILTYYEERYGRWIRLAPPLTADTLLLWGSPIVALLVGIIVVRRRRDVGSLPPILEPDRHRLRAEIARLRQTEDRP